MRRPPALILLTGRPVIAWLLVMAAVVTVLAWWSGAVPWWLGLLACLLVPSGFGAVGRRRTYLRWFDEWQAMGKTDEEAPPPKAPGKFWKGFRVVVAALTLIIVYPLVSHDAQPNIFLRLLVVACLIYLLVVGLRAVFRKKKERQEKDKSPVVAWAISRASSAPSRIDALRQLPEYSARLLGPPG